MNNYIDWCCYIEKVENQVLAIQTTHSHNNIAVLSSFTLFLLLVFILMQFFYYPSINH